MKFILAAVLTFFSISICYGQERNDQVIKQLNDISKTISEIKQDSDMRIGKIEETIQKLNSDSQKVYQPISDKNDQILKQLNEISKTLEVMKKDSDSRISKLEDTIRKMSGNSGSGTKKEVDYSSVLIVNNWSGTASVLINGQMHYVPAKTSLTVYVTPGILLWQCLDVLDSSIQRRTVVKGEVFRIKIYGYWKNIYN